MMEVFTSKGRDFRIHFTPTAGIVQITPYREVLAPRYSTGPASHCQPDTQDLIEIERLKGADMVLLDRKQAQAAPTRQMQVFAYKYVRGTQA